MPTRDDSRPIPTPSLRLKYSGIPAAQKTNARPPAVRLVNANRQGSLRWRLVDNSGG